MAYADKVTHMQRVAVITNPLENYTGNVMYEGVLIEGTLVLKEVNFNSNTVVQLEEDKIESWLESLNEKEDQENKYVLVYIDQENNLIEPRMLYKSEIQKDYRNLATNILSKIVLLDEEFSFDRIHFILNGNLDLSNDKNEHYEIELPMWFNTLEYKDQVKYLRTFIHNDIELLIGD